jgi:hypothetical protein
VRHSRSDLTVTTGIQLLLSRNLHFIREKSKGFSP